MALCRCFVFYMNRNGASKVPNLALKSGANQLAIYSNPADRYGRHDNTPIHVARGGKLRVQKHLHFCLESKHPGSLGPPCVANFRLQATHRAEICPSGLLCGALCLSLGLSTGLRCPFPVQICPFLAHKCQMHTMCCPKFGHHWVASTSLVPNLCPY